MEKFGKWKNHLLILYVVKHKDNAKYNWFNVNNDDNDDDISSDSDNNDNNNNNNNNNF